jgi:PAS domain S-box-containing protein
MFFGITMQPNKEQSENTCKNEEKYRNIIHDAPIAIYEVDFNGSKIIAVNPAVSQMVGYSEQELLEMNPLDLLVGNGKKKFYERVKEALTGRDTVFSAEYVVKTKSGQTIWVLLDAKVNYKDRKPDTVQVFARDVTERKKAAEKLKESEHICRTMFDSSGDGFLLIEPIFDKNCKACDFRFLMVNRAYEQQTNTKAANVLGKRASEVVPNLESNWVALCGNVVKTGESLHYENYNQRTNRWYDAFYFPYTKGQVAILFRDITQHKIAEEALAAREKEYRQLVEYAPAAIYEIDFAGPRFKNVNDAMCMISEYTREELLKLNPFDILSTESQVLFKQRIGKALAGERIEENVEYKAITKNGHELWVTLKMKLMSKDGKFYGAQVVANDVTEHKKAEETLRIEKERFEGLADSLPEIVFETDLNGKIVYANKRGFETTGYTEEDLDKGFDVFSLIAPQDKEKAIEYFKKTLCNQPTPYYEFTAAKKDGSTFPAIISAKLIIEKEGPTGLRGIVIDITERKKSELLVEDSKKRYQDLIETINDFVWEIDAQGRYTYCSPQMEKLWGLKSTEMIGKTPFDMMPPSAKEKALESFMELASSPKPFSGLEIPSYDSKGRLIFIEISGVPFFDVEGKLLGFRGISRDITERKKAEKALKDNERLAAIGQTAGMVGHDLRNPLQTIVSELYLAKTEINEVRESPQKINMQESLESIAEQVDYMDKIVSDLQTFVRPVEVQKEIINLKPLIVALLSQIDIPKNIETSIQVPEQLTAEADPQLLKRVLINLITNSIQAMPQGGELRITTHSSSSNRIEISVEDTGTGIPEEIKSKIFAPLFTTKSKGQGFGLAVCKRVIEAQDGSITFDSEEGKGAKFTIELPIS